MIRKLFAADSEICGRIWSGFNSYPYPLGGDWDARKITEELSAHFGIGVFDEQERLQAFCLYRQRAEMREVMLLATDLRHQRTGVMRRLIRSLIADLAQNELIWLEVHAENTPAISLYKSLGFQLTGKRPNYYKNGGEALLFEYKPLQ